MSDRQLDTAPATANQDPTPATKKEPGPGTLELQALIAKGPPDPKQVIALIDAHRGERDEMFKLLHTTLGNAYVQQVVTTMDHLRASVARKEVVDGDPSNPDGGYFLASAEEKGARWRTADGNFTGKADQKGLDSTYKLGAHDDLHATVDAKKKDGEIAWDHDGKKEGAIYGKKNDEEGSKGWEAGVRREDEIGGGTLTTSARHQVKEGVANDGLAAEYEKGATTVGVMGGVSGGKPMAGIDASHKLDNGATAHGSLEQVGGATTIEGGYKSPTTAVEGSLERHENGQFTGALTGSHQFDANNAISGSLAHNESGTSFGLAGSHRFNAEDAVSGSVNYSIPNGGIGQTVLTGHQEHNSSHMRQNADFEVGTGQRDYAKASGGLDLALRPNLYAGTFGNVSAERGHETTASIGASITFTPDEKSALTLAGIINEHGGIETRLQYDLFKNKIDGLTGISQHKKDAMLSLFLSYTTKGTNPGMLNDRFGAPQFDAHGAGGDGQVMAGIRIRF